MIFLFSLGVIVWLVVGVFNYGAYFGYFNSEFPWLKHEISLGVASLIIGPLALPAILVVGNKYKHLEWGPRTKEERWEAYKKDFPNAEKWWTIDNFEDPNKWKNI